MLVISRKVPQIVVIGGDVAVAVARAGRRSGDVRLAIVAPEGRKIVRSELLLPGDAGYDHTTRSRLLKAVTNSNFWSTSCDSISK